MHPIAFPPLLSLAVLSLALLFFKLSPRQDSTGVCLLSELLFSELLSFLSFWCVFFLLPSRSRRGRRRLASRGVPPPAWRDRSSASGRDSGRGGGGAEGQGAHLGGGVDCLRLTSVLRFLRYSDEGSRFPGRGNRLPSWGGILSHCSPTYVLVLKSCRFRRVSAGVRRIAAGWFVLEARCVLD